jgi:hypothetical protein
VVDCAIEGCFQEDQQMREDPRKWQVPELLFWSIPQPKKSTSKSQQDPAKKKQNTKSQTQECV